MRERRVMCEAGHEAIMGSPIIVVGIAGVLLLSLFITEQNLRNVIYEV